MELYENIRRLRKEQNLSQDELAKRAGYTDRSSIAKIENGDVDLPQSKIFLLAKALGVTASELMGDDGVTPSAEDLGKMLSDQMGDREMMEALPVYIGLTPEKKRHVIDTIYLLGSDS